MSDSENDDDNLFADSDDTAELIANSRSAPKAAVAKKKPSSSKPTKKQHKDKPDADNDSDDDDDKGLFDSSDDDNDEPAAKKKKISNGKGSNSQSMSKRQRLEALANKHRKEEGDAASKNKKQKTNPAKKVSSSNNNKKKEDKGYDSGDSYDSGDFQRTAEDDDFIDTTGEDADAVQELYAEQHFDDDRPDGESNKKKKKRQVRYDSDDPDRVSGGGQNNADVEPDNPIMAAVYRMKKKKVVKKGLSEMEDDVKTFLTRMEMAAEEDEQLIADEKPAIKKLSMLNEVCDMLTKRNMQRMLLDFDLLSVCKRWIQPLPNGTLGNVTVRQRLLEVIGNMNGDTGIAASDLKRSEFGKVVMILYKHRHETPAMKRQLKILIEQWSRPIFQKSGNMRDLERVTRGDTGLAALSRQHFMTEQQAAKLASSASSSAKGDDGTSATMASKGRSPDELNDLIAGVASASKKLEAGVNRVRVPYSKGFAFQVRPVGRTSSAADEAEQKRSKGMPSATETRAKLSKRMIEKNRPIGKNQRSSNISVEGRVTKG